MGRKRMITARATLVIGCTGMGLLAGCSTNPQSDDWYGNTEQGGPASPVPTMSNAPGSNMPPSNMPPSGVPGSNMTGSNVSAGGSQSLPTAATGGSPAGGGAPSTSSGGTGGIAVASGGTPQSLPPPPIDSFPPIDQPPTVTRVIPTDTRAAFSAATPPAPLSGGTLGVTPDGKFVVAADSAGDRLFVVDTVQRKLTHTIALDPGDEPGRVISGPAGQMFVALRRGGAVLTVNTADGTTVRRQACLAPRGMAYDSASDELMVACTEGKLVTFVGGEATPSVSVNVASDLRDVVLTNGRILVSRFRTAELLEVDPTGQVNSTFRPAKATGTHFVAQPDGSLFSSPVQFESTVAWRTIAAPDGSLMVLHHRDQDDEVQIPDEDHPSNDPFINPYGDGSSCSGIVRSAVTTLMPDGTMHTQFAPQAALAVDISIAPSGRFLAIANAGEPDQGTPSMTVDGNFISTASAAPGLMIVNVPQEDGPNGPEPADPGIDQTQPGTGAGADGGMGNASGGGDACNGDEFGVGESESVVAVAFNPDNEATLFAQTPTNLQVVDLITRTIVTQIPLGVPQQEDTGFGLFHRISNAGLACASCHPEGRDDGHVWTFSNIGPRRTQPLDVGLEGTAPFHWDGSLNDLGSLMSEVFVGRMGGVFESPDRLNALQNWLFAVKPPTAQRQANDPLVVQGEALFNSPAVACAACHSGSKFTNNLSYNVGTTPAGEKLQVPSLIGVGYRSRLMHDGCANSLQERFLPACGGGDLHGKTSQLSSDEINALIAYLQSL
ncbi:MAG TPA: hypothetical protein VL137_13595 [Polyangiaceae bacterium]|nr:hypothetical protein [Polyangiaceae bacterium]